MAALGSGAAAALTAYYRVNEGGVVTELDTVHLTHGDAAVVVAGVLAEMADLYDEVHAAPRYDSGSLWRREAFLDRTRVQMDRDGFAIVLARSDTGELVGFSFGLPLGAGRWWGGGATAPPDEILSTSKFALIELDVRGRWRGQGIGRKMHDKLLTGRPEQYAILTTLPTEPARQMYQRWGWRQVGTAQHSPDSPVMDALVLTLG